VVDRARAQRARTGSAVAGLMAAIADEAVERKARLVTDFTALNWGICGWGMTMADVAEIVSALPRDGYISSLDMPSGFHYSGSNPADRSLLAVRHGGRYWQPTRLMFGLKQAPAAFSVLSAELTQTAHRRFHWLHGDAFAAAAAVRYTAYIDDLFTVAADEASGKVATGVLKDYGAVVNVIFRPDKERPPSQEGPVLGVLVNSRDMTIRLPAAKRYNYALLALIVLVADATGVAVPRSLLRKLVGKLSYAASVLRGGTARMIPLWQTVADAGEEAEQQRLPALARGALEWFAEELLSERGARRALIPSPDALSGAPWVFSHSDASGDVGFGLTVGPLVVHGTWRDDLRDADAVSIGARELYPLALLVAEAGDLFAGRLWQPRMDNLPNVFALLSGRTHDRDAHAWLAAVLTCQEAGGTTLVPTWLPREGNVFMDEVSKAESPEEARRVAAAFRLRGGEG
jgi:hypothetical protein